MINKIIADQGRDDYNRIFAIGGGSVIDIAKVLVLKDAKITLDIFEKTVPIIKDKELIVVPTTCGTGSEVTNISIAFIESKGTKMGLAVDELFPDHAVLIPSCLEKLPFEFFVYSSMDALIHASESFLSPRANNYTETFSIRAIEMIMNGYRGVNENGKDYRNKTIEQFLVASNYAGIAFGNAGVGAVHALSYPQAGTNMVPQRESTTIFSLGI
jgi:4-hydroxybutyrate dehydrogenase